MPKKLTHDEFVARLLAVKPHLLVVGEYLASSKPILVKCTIDDHVWEVNAHSILLAGNCPVCAAEKKLTVTSRARSTVLNVFI